MAHKPIIGVVADRRSEYPGIYVPEAYMDALADAGALPVVLPFATVREDIARLAGQYDGYLLTGGADVNPRAYGEPVLTHCGELQPIRDAFELAIVPLLVALDKPLLAICRGVQALNVAMGGSLYQDIDALHPRTLRLQHSQQAAHEQATHALTIAPQSKLGELWGNGEVWVNTFHHQAVNQAPLGFIPTAWAADGVIEAIEKPSARFLLGVQWHPELMARADAKSAALFSAFVAAC